MSSDERPRLRISPFSEFYHVYLTPLMLAPPERKLALSSLPRVPIEDDAACLLDAFSRRLARLRPSGSGRAIQTATLRLLFPRFHLIALWQLLGLSSDGAMPFIIAEVVRDLRTDDPRTIGRRFGYIVALGVLCLVNTAALQQVLWNGSRCGMRAKIGLAAAVYDKMMRLELGVTSSWSSAEVSNVIAIDLLRLELAAMFGHFIWSTPLCLIMCATLAWLSIGISALPGIVFLVILVVVQWSLGWPIARLRNRVARATDDRVKLMQDVLLGSAALKVNAWEEALEARLRKLRAIEHKDIAGSLHILTSIEAAIFFAPGLATFASILSYRYIFQVGKPLEVEQGFAVLSIFAVLVKQLNIFPRAVKTFDEQIISFRRVERFLLLPEIAPARIPGGTDGTNAKAWIDPESQGSGPSIKTPADSEPGDVAVGGTLPLVVVEAACGNWEGGQSRGSSTSRSGVGETRRSAPKATLSCPVEKAGATSSELSAGGEASFSLRDISLRVRPGEVHMLCGQIGSGKTSTLQLLLGEMRLRSGAVHVAFTKGGGVGYVPQVSWILNSTFRDNITMGRLFDREWYDRVIRCCALEPDQARIGELTLIGERGVTVSGGQRARISLARALYGRPLVFLLDDPLSAVDAHVAQHLVEHCLVGEMRAYGAAVVLASHQVHLAGALATAVHIMENGAIVASGSPGELMLRGLLPSADERSQVPVRTGEDDSTAVRPDGEAAQARAQVLAMVILEEKREEPTSGTAGTGDAPTTGKLPTGQQHGVQSAAEMGRDASRREAAFFFMRSMGGALYIVPVLVLVLCLAACRVLADWSLGEWIRNGTLDRGAILYASLISGTVVTGLVQGFAVVSRMLGASSRIHDTILGRVLRAPKAWFDVTPQGLVLAIFSKDQDTLDDLLPATLIALLKCIIIVSTALTLGIIAVPAVLVLLPVVYFLFRRLTTFYQRTASQLKRLDKATTGPVISRFAETFAGLASVRALRLQVPLGKQLLQQLSDNNTAHFLWTASGRWLAVRLDWVATSIVVAVGCGVVCFHLVGIVTPSLAGLALVYILQITSLFQWGFRTYAELQNHFVSVERALAYTKIPQEAAAVLPTDSDLVAAHWPQHGAVHFHSVCMRYRPELPLVLCNLDVRFEPGLKSALVGRTGAGKSSITAALFRLVELDSGSIEIDGVDTSDIGLRQLRRSMVIIQQEALLFSGTIRSNLDPLEQTSDERLRVALDKVDFARLAGGSLDLHTAVSDAGVNLSAGTRQLLMLARAMLSDARILVMDEATANCDMETDATMQRAVRAHFNGSTIITVAHRLDTIIDYDRIFVMDAGAVIESGSPAGLLETEGSCFGKLCAEAGIGRQHTLRGVIQA